MLYYIAIIRNPPKIAFVIIEAPRSEAAWSLRAASPQEDKS